MAVTPDKLVKGARKFCEQRGAAGDHDPVLVPCDACLGRFASGEDAPTWIARFVFRLLRG